MTDAVAQLQKEIERLSKRLKRERLKREKLEEFAEQKTRELYQEKEKLDLIGQVISATTRYADLLQAAESCANVLLDFQKADSFILFESNRSDFETLFVSECKEFPQLNSLNVKEIIWGNKAFDRNSQELQKLHGEHAGIRIIFLVQRLAGTADCYVALSFASKQRFIAFDSDILVNIAHQLTIVMDREKDAALIHQMSHYDQLTQLVSKPVFIQKLASLIKQNRGSHLKLAIVALDIVDMGLINSRYSMDFGNRLLKHIASEIALLLRHHDCITRQMGDCFLFYLMSDRIEDAVAGVLQRIQLRFGQPLIWHGEKISVDFHIGYVQDSLESLDIEQAIQCATLALKQAKKRRQSPVLYNSSMIDRALSTQQLDMDLRKALENREFVLFYQPIVDLHAGEFVKAEALIRWRKGEQLISPVEFIPYLEDSDLIIPVGRWVIERALTDLKQWQEQQLSIKKVSVNVSVRQLDDASLAQWVESVLTRLDLPANSLILEVTESLSLESTDAMEAFFNGFVSQGVELALDDFGTGYSSLSYLHRYPFSKLKIDRAFVMNLDQGSKSYDLLKSIVALSKALQMTCIAEGIETDEARQLLAHLGVEFGQGFFFSRPLPADEFVKLIL